MIRPTAFVLALPSIITVSAALTLTRPSPIFPSSVNASDSLPYRCLKEGYGRDFDSASCMEALSQIDASATIAQTYGQRFLGPYDVTLPKRYTSLTGTCAIEPRIVPGRPSARASLQEVASAARQVIDHCINAPPYRGGIAMDIGGDNNLMVAVAKMDTQVQCYGTVSPSLAPSCQKLLDVMPASTGPITFGPQDGPEADVKVPTSYRSYDRKCKLTIRTDGHMDSSSDYQIWSLATALTNTCVRRGQMGLQNNFGSGRHLILEIGPA